METPIDRTGYSIRSHGGEQITLFFDAVGKPAPDANARRIILVSYIGGHRFPNLFYHIVVLIWIGISRSFNLSADYP